MIDFDKWQRTTYRVADMRPYGDNPRRITKEGLRILKESLESIGYVDDISLFKDGTIAGGHARYYILLDEGVEEVPVKLCRDELTPKQMQEVVIRLNKNVAGEWDHDILANSFDHLNLVTWGWTLQELDIDISGIMDDAPPKEKDIEFLECPKCEHRWPK